MNSVCLYRCAKEGAKLQNTPQLICIGLNPSYFCFPRSKAWIYFAQWSRHVYFTSWLDNICEFRGSMAEIARHYNYVLTFVNYSLSSECGLLICIGLNPSYIYFPGSKAWICFAHWSRHVYFTSWLDNICEFRGSMAEIISGSMAEVITTMFWPLSTILCQVNAGYLYHHLWSETRQTGYSMEVTIRLESALDLVKKMERGNERHWREPRDESILKKFPKPSW